LNKQSVSGIPAVQRATVPSGKGNPALQRAINESEQLISSGGDILGSNTFDGSWPANGPLKRKKQPAWNGSLRIDNPDRLRSWFGSTDEGGMGNFPIRRRSRFLELYHRAQWRYVAP
jgi:hypothetical protein